MFTNAGKHLVLWFSLLTLLLVSGCNSSSNNSQATPAAATATASESQGTAASPSASASATAPSASATVSTASSTSPSPSGTTAPQTSPSPSTTAGPAKPTATVKPSTAPAASAKPTPSPTTAPSSEDAKTQDVTISIMGDSDTGTILETTSVALKKNDTVLDILKRTTRSHKIQMEYKGSGAMAYIEGINNLYEFDKGAKSGWMYRVNGDFPSKSAGAYKLEAGDVIEWLYTTDLGKDIGGEVKS